MEVDTHEVLYDKLTYIYVEIPKFDNQERKLYEDSVNAYRDIVNAIRTAEKKSELILMTLHSVMKIRRLQSR